MSECRPEIWQCMHGLADFFEVKCPCGFKKDYLDSYEEADGIAHGHFEQSALWRSRLHVLGELEGMEGTWTDDQIPVSRSAREARQTLMKQWGVDEAHLADYLASLGLPPQDRSSER